MKSMRKKHKIISLDFFSFSFGYEIDSTVIVFLNTKQDLRFLGGGFTFLLLLILKG